MKTFLLDLIPKIQRYSEKLDNISVLTNKHWVLLNEEIEKTVYIFRELNNQLLISKNGKIEKATWEYLGNNSLLIDQNNGSYLFKHGFVDDTILALKIDGSDEYALLINEQKFENYINSLSTIISFLNKKYVEQKQKCMVTIPDSKTEPSKTKRTFTQSLCKDKFIASDYPDLDIDMVEICSAISRTSNSNIAEILISFCRDHSLDIALSESNFDFTKLVVNKQVPISLLEHLFKINKNNLEFITVFEKYIKTTIEKYTC